MVQLRFLVSSTALLLAACSTSDATPEASSTVDHVESTSPSPIAILVESELGYTIEEVNAAVLDKRGTVVEDCMDSAGFTVEPWQLPTGDVVARPAPAAFGGTAEQAIRSMDDELNSTGNDAAFDEPAYQAALSTCYEVAREVPDPSVELLGWLMEAMSDVTATVESSPQIAREASTKLSCLAAAGFPDGDAAALQTDFSDRVNAQISSYLSAAQTRETTIANLNKIANEEDTLAVEYEKCNAPYEAAVRDLTYALQKGFIENQGAAIADELERIRPAVVELREYLLLRAQPSA